MNWNTFVVVRKNKCRLKKFKRNRVVFEVTEEKWDVETVAVVLVQRILDTCSLLRWFGKSLETLQEEITSD